MSLKSFDEDRVDVWLANIQIVASLAVLLLYPFLSLKHQILAIGVVTMITWFGTALAHRSAAKGKIAIKAQEASVEADEVTVKERDADRRN